MAGGRGGKRQGAGRPKGSTHKVPPWKGQHSFKALEEAAQKASARAIEIVCHIMENGKSDATRLSACSIIIERAWGKPKQSHQHKHSVEQKDKPITEVDIVGQVDLRRLSNDELREFERLLDRATVPPPIEARPILTSKDHQD
jgi:hypothetical protein